MGTGCACLIASENQVGGLILMSPFTSIRNVSRDLAGIAGNLVADRFNNIDIISKVTCPV